MKQKLLLVLKEMLPGAAQLTPAAGSLQGEKVPGLTDRVRAPGPGVLARI